LREAGTPVAYATNNASRRPAEVASLLTGMGIAATEPEVLTSARAAAALLADRLPAGAPVLVVGAEALRAEVRDAGLKVVTSAEDAPVAVVQGYGPQVAWPDLAEASVAIRAGSMWVATNTDRTLPTARGPLPGNGALVAALATALERQPDVVVGKPEPGLFAAAARQAGARRPLVVGDRLDTDIEGAVRAGMDSLLVLTGVSRPAELLAAPAARRPTYVAADLGGLFEADTTGGWRASRTNGRPTLDGSGPPVAALRLLCTRAWAGEPVDGVVAISPEADAALRELGLLG
jgi:HAD superfamily hydrolase (TIGR01450 family)